MKSAVITIGAICLCAASVSAQTVNDAQIASIVVTANQVDIDAGKLAAATTANAEVKKFAQLMVTDHTGVNKQAVDLVTKLKVTPQDNDTSKSLKAGDTFSFSTVYDVLMNNYIVIPKGTRGQGKVTWRTGKGAFGKSAKMDLSFDWIDVGGRRVTIEGKHRQEGSGNTAATVGTAVAVGPFAAFVTGKSATVPNGMHLKAFTTEPIQFQVAGLVAAPQQAHVVPSSGAGPVVTQGTSPAVSAVSSGDESQ